MWLGRDLTLNEKIYSTQCNLINNKTMADKEPPCSNEVG